MFHIAAVRGLHGVGGSGEWRNAAPVRCDDVTPRMRDAKESTEPAPELGGWRWNQPPRRNGARHGAKPPRVSHHCPRHVSGLPIATDWWRRSTTLAPVLDIQRVAGKSPLDVRHERATSTAHRGCSSLDRPRFGLMVIAQRGSGHWHDASTAPLRPVANPAVAMTSH